ncbi:hypothetical protein [uncultured Pontibacter sp.]|uniref:hypothetical protein n=1 Tax=uncultured Pontibacter sp. TaxID=453356 RepID=UPI00261B9E55|nr:hypothetical protein [uncultured Pontibacter sp.]
MKKELFALAILSLLSFSCSTKENVEVEDTQITSNSKAVTERHEYWPLENEMTREDTILRLDDQYHISMITHSLNDSSAVYTMTDDMGEIIVHAHNRETTIEILKNQKPFIKTVLNRNIFSGRDKELRHSGASFLRYGNGEFHFVVDACVPDSDVCDAAEVAVDQKGQVRVIRYIEQEEETED